MKSVARLFASALLAGACIGIGATAYLLCENRYIGAILFSVGLVMVKEFDLKLYTGYISRALQYRLKGVFDAFIIFCGNVCGAFLLSILTCFSTIGEALQGKAYAIMQSKLSAGIASWFIMAMLCNVMIYLATYRKDHILTLFGVTVFVLCGFEHSIADALYIAISGAYTLPHSWAFLTFVALGNAVGGILWHNIMKFAGD